MFLARGSQCPIHQPKLIFIAKKLIHMRVSRVSISMVVFAKGIGACRDEIYETDAVYEDPGAGEMVAG